jgi:hypothetical protein
MFVHNEEKIISLKKKITNYDQLVNKMYSEL